MFEILVLALGIAALIFSRKAITGLRDAQARIAKLEAAMAAQPARSCGSRWPRSSGAPIVFVASQVSVRLL